MGVVLPQLRLGYIRGVRGAVVQTLNADGTNAAPIVRFGIRTAQQVSVETVSEGGEDSRLRGGDRVLARVKDPDTIVGVNLTLQNARFDARAIQLIAGGTLITVVEGPDTRIIGWEAPTIAAQQNPPWVRIEVYAVNHNAVGGIDQFLMYTFRYCRGSFGNETLQDQNWVIPELNIECMENPQGGGVYRKEFVAVLPAELI